MTEGFSELRETRQLIFLRDRNVRHLATKRHNGQEPYTPPQIVPECHARRRRRRHHMLIMIMIMLLVVELDDFEERNEGTPQKFNS